MRIPTRSAATIHSLPFTGYGGFIGQCLRPILDSGASLTNYPFDVDELLRLIRAHRPVALHLVPTMFRLLLDHPDTAGTDMSSIRLIVSGSASLAHDTIVRAMTLWPHIRIHNPYSMSEGGFTTAAVTPEQLAKPGCVGAIQPNMEIRDETGKPVAQGVVGEIYGKASGKPRRYWNDSESSDMAWVDGWTRSGDLGCVDADGDLILTGRAKELIIRGGYNIAPIEIEDVLHAHPAVQDAAVVGVSHDVLGEDVGAAVSLVRGATVTPEDLVAWCRTKLAANKVPRTIVILDALPVNQNAKILKRELQPMVEQAAHADRARRHAQGPGAGSDRRRNRATPVAASRPESQ
jgi:long-chain acyl-CoA synthetase